jgi:hypothetical protein
MQAVGDKQSTNDVFFSEGQAASHAANTTCGCNEHKQPSIKITYKFSGQQQ